MRFTPRRVALPNLYRVEPSAQGIWSKEFADRGLSVVVLEADPRYVRRISKTVDYKGFPFDIGGHRFFAKSKEVEDQWTEAFEALTNLGTLESRGCVVSDAIAELRPVDILFKTYTEKVWGMSCREISADWAAQRIQALSPLAGRVVSPWRKAV